MRIAPTIVALGRSLRQSERSSLERWLRAAVKWQKALRGFPPPLAGAPDATPYVSLYANGVLRGCYGSHEGSPGERLARAFVLALTDSRYGGIQPGERATLEASLAYLAMATPVRTDEVLARVEPGIHGLATGSTLILPSVARERGFDGARLLEALAKKADQETLEGIVWLTTADEVSTRGVRSSDSIRAAKRWLASLVDKNGEVAFEIDPMSGHSRAEGVMRHGRIAVAIEALGPAGRKAKKWLAREIDRGLDIERKDMLLGTLALAARAGLDVPLLEHARAIDPHATSPWHAAQAASVLGKDTPEALWDVAVTNVVSPYLAMAARLRGDADVLERSSRALIAAIRARAPFEGGVAFTAIPETALTAAAIEALAPLRTKEARSAVKRGRAFLAKQQILDVPPSLHPRTLGAFRASPIAPVFRCDITAHAVLALA